MKKGTNKTRVNVTDISSYAVNPSRYSRFKGKAYNPAAAKKGTVAHKAIGRTPIYAKALLLLFTLVLMALLWGLTTNG